MRSLRTIVAVALVLLVSACGPRVVTSQVTRFHQLPPGFAGQTFTILPESDQVGSLEFQSYADQVAAQLAAHGLQPVASGGDLVVKLDYGIGSGRTAIYTRPSTYGSFGVGCGGFGWPHRRWGTGLGLGMGFPLGDPWGPGYYDTYAVTKYDRWLAVDILEGPSFRQGRPISVFEGRAVSEGSSRALPQVMPYLARALFDNFPGMSGQTVRVAVPVGG
jgi:hypothetical protein